MKIIFISFKQNLLNKLLALRYLALAAVVLIISSCTSTMTTVRHSTTYENDMHTSNNIAILPPNAEINTVDAFNKKTRMYEYEAYLEKLIAREIAPALRAKGYKVKVIRNYDIHNKKLSSSFARLRNSYNKAREDLYSQPLWKKEKAFAISKKIGTVASDISKKLNSNLIVMIDHAGYTKTSGARTFDFIGTVIGGMAGVHTSNNIAESSVIIIGIINAAKGEVIWTNMARSAKDIFSAASTSSDLAQQEAEDVKMINKLLSHALSELRNKNSSNQQAID